MSDLLTTSEAAEFLRKSTRFVRDEFKRGNLRGFRYGGELHFSPGDLQAYIDSHANVIPVAERRKRRSA